MLDYYELVLVFFFFITNELFVSHSIQRPAKFLHFFVVFLGHVRWARQKGYPFQRRLVNIEKQSFLFSFSVRS